MILIYYIFLLSPVKESAQFKSNKVSPLSYQHYRPPFFAPSLPRKKSKSPTNSTTSPTNYKDASSDATPGIKTLKIQQVELFSLHMHSCSLYES